jgi:hypothetical protein
MKVFFGWKPLVLLGAYAILPMACQEEENQDNSPTDQTNEGDTQEHLDDTDTSHNDETEEQATHTESDSEKDTTSDDVSLSCEDLVEGANVGFVAHGLKRKVTLNFPNDVETAGPWPVIFGWHGVGDTDDNFSGFLSPLVNNPSYRFISVTPDDRNLMPPVGFEWAYFKGNENNADIALFDALVECLDQRFGVDRDRIHTFGLSGGAIMSDFLAVMRGDELASVVTYSGGYFSNPDNPSSALIKSMFSWPELAENLSYAQLLVHGGDTDSYSLVLDTIHFDQMTLADVPYLNRLGHDVLLCNHGLGHPVIPSEIWADQAVAFFADHPRTAVDSPYAVALPDWVPDYCDLLLKTD